MLTCVCAHVLLCIIHSLFLWSRFCVSVCRDDFALDLVVFCDICFACRVICVAASGLV